jgi:phosphoesterase RecJ-like protein
MASGQPLDQAIQEFIAAFRTSQRVVLTTHVNPDGDGLGSEIALACWLKERGIETAIINHSPTPAVYRWLDPRAMIRTFEKARDTTTLRSADLIITLDANHPERLRSMQEAVLASPATKAVIDHHLDPHPFASLTLIDEDATSTGELVFRLLTAGDGKPLTDEIASALYCAILTDTGSFRYPRVDPEIHQIAARLIENGADPVTIYTRVYEQWSRGRIHLLGEMLAGLDTTAGGRIAHVSVTREMLARTGTSEEDTDNFTLYPMSVEGVQAGILFLELAEGVKVSFRSRGSIPINELAKEFGGNGHMNAAGARINGRSLADVRRNVLRAAAKYVVEGSQ